MYKVLDVAKYVIAKCEELDEVVSNLKLQKILYFIQAEFLVVKGQPCFEERLEAWDFGPVAPDVYHEYKIYGAAGIPNTSPVQSGNIMRLFQNEDKALADGIIEECAKYTASQLVDFTHKQEPWIEAYHKSRGARISPESIKKFFKEG